MINESLSKKLPVIRLLLTYFLQAFLHLLLILFFCWVFFFFWLSVLKCSFALTQQEIILMTTLIIMHSENQDWSLRWILGQQSFHMNLSVDCSNLFCLPWLQGCEAFYKRRLCLVAAGYKGRPWSCKWLWADSWTSVGPVVAAWTKSPTTALCLKIFLMGGWTSISFLMEPSSSSFQVSHILCACPCKGVALLYKCLWLLWGRMMVLRSPTFLSLPWPMLSCVFATVPRQYKEIFLQGHQQDAEEKACADFGVW